MSVCKSASLSGTVRNFCVHGRVVLWTLMVKITPLLRSTVAELASTLGQHLLGKRYTSSVTNYIAICTYFGIYLTSADSVCCFYF